MTLRRSDSQALGLPGTRPLLLLQLKPILSAHISVRRGEAEGLCGEEKALEAMKEI